MIINEMILSVAFLATLAVTTNNHIDHRMLSWSPIYSTRLSGNSREQQKPSPEDRRGGIVFDASRQIVMPAAELIASNGNLKVSTVGGSDKDDKGKTRFTPEQIDGLVKLHNTLRSNIQPSAADMNFMQWDDRMATLAQRWADKCKFEPGFPPDAGSRIFGQNMFLTKNIDVVNGQEAVRTWFKEKVHYDMEKGTCQPDRMCSNYTQLVWAHTKLVGCGISKCKGEESFVVCYYSPPGNIGQQRPYITGRPCSSCPIYEDGGLCYNDTCVCYNDCVKFNLPCDCPLMCQNCGTLYANNCTCNCKKTWDGLDCSIPCANADDKCDKTPGYQPSQCEGNETIRELCHKMCGQCTSMVFGSNTDRDVCCYGKVCELGYILDRQCNCVKNCPGPLCSKHEENLTTHDEMTAETTISEDPASKPTDYTLKERRGIELASTPKPRCSATLSLLFRAQVVVVVLMATVIDAVHYYYMTAPVEEHIGN